jgi:hypothetical protein
LHGGRVGSEWGVVRNGVGSTGGRDRSGTLHTLDDLTDTDASGEGRATVAGRVEPEELGVSSRKR